MSSGKPASVSPAHFRVMVWLMAAGISGGIVEARVKTQAEQGLEAICLIMTGSGGTPEYEETFAKWADATEKICTDSLRATSVRLDGSRQGREGLLSTLGSHAVTEKDLWLFVIGHGTFDGRTYRFNVQGRDLSPADFQEVLAPRLSARTYLVLATSCSGELATPLKGPGRIVLSATRSGREQNPPLFMSFLLEAATSAEADRNKDRKLSLQEVFEFADTRIGNWYREEGRIQTEHPVLLQPDSGSVNASLTYLSAPPEKAYRTLQAREMAGERNRLERSVESLKLRKHEFKEEDYYQELEKLLLRLAELNQTIRTLEEGN